MPIIDDRARVFGKLNVIDAIVGLLILVLIPLGYGAFLLFRVPVPTITAIEPQQVIEHEQVTVQITGQDLRPFLRARFGTVESGGFLLQSPTLGEIKVPANLPPGTYDLTLYDQGQQLVRKPGALTVVARQPPYSAQSAVVQAVGEFIGFSQDDVGLIRVGSTFGPIVEILAVRTPEPQIHRLRVGGDTIVATPVIGHLQVPAIVLLRCQIASDQCQVGDTAVVRNAVITLPAPPDRSVKSGRAAPEPVRFVVKEVRPADARVAFPYRTTAIATLRVRFVVPRELVKLVKVGDVDVGGRFGFSNASKARLTAVEFDDQTVTTTGNVDRVVGASSQLRQPVVAFTGTLHVPVVMGGSGWQYRDKPVKVGAPFAFETTRGFMDGSILDMRLGSAVEVPVR